MTKDEALKLALEAMEQWNTPLYKRGVVIAAIKEALAQPAQEPEPDELTIAYMNGLLDGKKQRSWIGLDEQDFSAINQSCLTKLQAAASAESILKEKNN